MHPKLKDDQHLTDHTSACVATMLKETNQVNVIRLELLQAGIYGHMHALRSVAGEISHNLRLIWPPTVVGGVFRGEN